MRGIAVAWIRRYAGRALLYPILLIMLPCGAQAGDIGTSGFDIDGDGRITMDEVMRHLRPSVQKGFDALDRNHDGVLSRDDFRDVREGMRRMQDWLDSLPGLFSEPDGESREF